MKYELDNDHLDIEIIKEWLALHFPKKDLEESVGSDIYVFERNLFTALFSKDSSEYVAIVNDCLYQTSVFLIIHEFIEPVFMADNTADWQKSLAKAKLEAPAYALAFSLLEDRASRMGAPTPAGWRERNK